MADLAMDLGLGLATGGSYTISKFLGGQMGLFGSKAPDYSDLITQREAEINAFAQKLDAARNSVLTNYQNLQANAMKRFLPAYTANLSGRNISPDSGAFASGVGAEAANLQGQYDTLNTQLTNQNLNTIGGLQASLWGQRLGTDPRMLNYQNSMQTKQAFGGLLGTVASMGIGRAMGMSGMMMPSMGRNVMSNPNTSSGSNSIFGDYSGSDLYDRYSPTSIALGRRLNLRY